MRLVLNDARPVPILARCQLDQLADRCGFEVIERLAVVPGGQQRGANRYSMAPAMSAFRPITSALPPKADVKQQGR